MRKINNSNNKFRNNAIYSLNYKFDSVSSAGKFSGTALELIKKYNELAKEAQSNGNYVEMEVFRQYAEHYRKIVTEINERKNQYRENQNETENAADNNADNASPNEAQPADNGLVETESAEQPVASDRSAVAEDMPEKKVRRRRNFTIIEVSENADNETEQNSEKPRRRLLGRKPRVNKTTAENTVSEES